MLKKVDRFTVTGGVGASGTKYINLDGSGISITIRVSDVGAKRSGLDEALAMHQIIVTPAERARIIEQASEIEHYLQRPYAERGGWVDADHYIRRDGDVTGNSAEAGPPRIAFTVDRRGTGQRGTLSGWRRRVARPLTGQVLPQFLIMAGLAGPVLPLTQRSLNVLFEIVGAGGEGKSSALQIAASTCGSSVERGAGTYWFVPSGTTNWLEQRMLAHADSTAFMDEFEVFGADSTPAKRSQMIYDFVFRFSEGQTRGRLDGVPTISFRGLGLLTVNQPVRDLMTARHAAMINPTTSRLVSQPGDVGFGFGTLDFLPEGHKSARSFISSILLATQENFGTAMPAFLEGIVGLRACDENGLRQQVCDHVETFIARAAGGAGGLHARIAESYAIVYVTGRLARHLNILPKEWDPFAIALECYRRCVASMQVAEGKPARDVLKTYASRPDVIDLDKGLPTLSDKEIATVSGFRQTVRGSTELIVPPANITRLFADWERIKETKEIARYLRREGQHFGRKRVVRAGGGKQRLLVFAGFD